MPVQQQFKKFEVITADTAEQMGLSITAMLLQGIGWQLSTPMMCASKPDGSLHYYVGMMLFEYIQTPDAPVETPSTETQQ